jgi:hypothetical protein
MTLESPIVLRATKFSRATTLRRDYAWPSPTSIMQCLLTLAIPLYIALAIHYRNHLAKMILTAMLVVTPWGSRTIPLSMSPTRMMRGRSNNIKSLGRKSKESVVLIVALAVIVTMTIIKIAKTHALPSGASRLPLVIPL